ncbi:hypothetical protein [Micromonospora chersina]|uniref:hypothetical protein n=1 Tax=Micromonospora chersina TaxID=47854 RepID=UPI00370FF5F4
MPTTLLLARILLGIQALILSSVTLLVVPALFLADPEVRSPWQDLLLGAATVGATALAVTSVIRLGAARPWSWTAAVSAHLVALAGYGWFMFDAMTADVPEGMLFFSAVVVGTPLVLLSVAGLVLLLVPGSVKHGFGRRRAT